MYTDPIVLIMELLIIVACMAGGFFYSRSNAVPGGPAGSIVGGTALALILILLVRVILLGHV